MTSNEEYQDGYKVYEAHDAIPGECEIHGELGTWRLILLTWELPSYYPQSAHNRVAAIRAKHSR